MTGTVLFFVYSNKYICANRIEGARRYAEKVGWNIQVIERNNVDRPLIVWGHTPRNPCKMGLSRGRLWSWAVDCKQPK